MWPHALPPAAARVQLLVKCQAVQTCEACPLLPCGRSSPICTCCPDHATHADHRPCHCFRCRHLDHFLLQGCTLHEPVCCPHAITCAFPADLLPAVRPRAHPAPHAPANACMMQLRKFEACLLPLLQAHQALCASAQPHASQPLSLWPLQCVAFHIEPAAPPSGILSTPCSCTAPSVNPLGLRHFRCP